MSAYSRPSLLRRIQSSFIDGILTFVLVAALMALCNRVNDESALLKILALALGASYEPLLTFYGRTVGQWVLGLRVVPAHPGERLNLASLYLRYLVKMALGWVSFLTIHAGGRAIHDYAGHTVVVYAAELVPATAQEPS